MLVLCDRCNQQNDAKMNPETEEVICSECGEIITNISSFTKQSMKSRREFTAKKKQAFSFNCEKCKKIQGGVLSKDKTKVLCSKCGSVLNVSAFMLNALVNLDRQQQSK